MRAQSSQKGTASLASSADERTEEIKGSRVRPLEVIDQEEKRLRCHLLQRLIHAVKQAKARPAFTSSSFSVRGNGGKQDGERREVSFQIDEESIGKRLCLFITAQGQKPRPCCPESLANSRGQFRFADPCLTTQGDDRSSLNTIIQV